MARLPDDILSELLVIRTQDGDPEALGELVRMWHGRFVAFAEHLLGGAADAPDAVQEAWGAIARRVRTVHDPAMFRGWAFRIVSNKCRDAARRAGRERRAVERAMHHGQGERANEPANGDDLQAVRDAIRNLAEDDRALVLLRYREGLGVREIALAFGVPEGTIKRRLHAAREQIRHQLERNES